MGAQVCALVVRAEVSLPPDQLSEPVRLVLAALLHRQPSSRLVGVSELMAHRFFEPIEWRALLEKRVRAPWVPAQIATGDAPAPLVSGARHESAERLRREFTPWAARSSAKPAPPKG